MNPVILIEKKKSGGKLSPSEIKLLVDGYLSGKVREYQMSAFLMAVYFQGMDDEETANLTSVMLRSGRAMEWPASIGPVVDKHSTGGVGDKVSLALAPIAASLGIKVPMLSGRALGHTGGTLDKLESIPGFQSLLSLSQMEDMLTRVGCFISGQTEEIAPADRKLYALRDVTGTVDCIPLIVSSILSKKLAEGIKALVLDVKYGAGAFMPSLAMAKRLARALKKTGEKLGLDVRVLLTAMHQPLGFAVGCSLEVIEVIGLLRGTAPRDLAEVTVNLAVEMVLAAGIQTNRKTALGKVKQSIASGAALRLAKKWVRGQGGSLDYKKQHLGLDVAPIEESICMEAGGFIRSIDARSIGLAVIDLGGGRKAVHETVDHGVGVVFRKKVGDRLREGEPICRIYARNTSTLALAREKIQSAISLGRTPPKRIPELIKFL